MNPGLWGYPQARSYHYDLALKARLVLKAKQVISKGRLEMDADPEPVSRLRLLDYVEAMFNGRWYEPPFPLDGLADAFRASPTTPAALAMPASLCRCSTRMK